ncbi:hypothetical protein [Anabaena azotica]|uniref:Uncharacterized protein n=1 Tax=Anabaena azotica FACHB-119 TaxID=947527 RepID=A0ABR8DFU3_9NOST|nr:hypothetical protein [Anabaena azotica]MBD2504593.1 hypothetical protein [Anabaena azotica FACHB-119]
MNGYNWRDSRGATHGEECREKFFETHCKICGAYAWYFQCLHGCKVFFHKVPWIHGNWDANCPAKHGKTDDCYYIIDSKDNSLNYNFDEEDNSLNYNFDEEDNSLNYNFDEDL